MKTKRVIKKLVLSKETISDLNDRDMNSARGGYETIYTCTTCQTGAGCTNPGPCEETVACTTFCSIFLCTFPVWRCDSLRC